MTRELKLLSYIESQMEIPFEYGVHDCTLFVAGAIDVMYNTKLRNKYTGLWHDKKSAEEYRIKNPTLSKVLYKVGYKTIDFSFIQTGDIIVMEQKLEHEEKWQSVSVFTGSKVAMMTDAKCVELVPLNKVPNICEVLRCHR